MSKYILSLILLVVVSSKALGETPCEGLSFENLPHEISNLTEYFNARTDKFRKELPTLDELEEGLSEKKRVHCTGKTNYLKIAKTITLELMKTALGAGAGLVAGRVVDRVAPQAPGAAGAGTTMFMASSLGAAITSSVSNVFTAVGESSLTLEEGLKNVHREVQADSESLVASLTPDHKSQIERLDTTIAQMIHEKQGENAFRCLSRRQLFVSIPNRIQNVAHYEKGGDPKMAQAIDNRVEALLARYPERIREPLSLLVQAIRDNSISEQGAQVQAFLYGPTGTGKTTFVMRLGEALGLPVCVINLSKIEPNELLGQEFVDLMCAAKNEEAIGKIAACFVEAGVLNPLIFFDEAGEYLGESAPAQGFDINHMKKQVIQASFKRILDPNNLALKLAALGFKIPTTRVNYIFASNYPVTDLAILSRMPQYYFASLTRAEKTAAAEVAFTDKRRSLAHFMESEKITQLESIAREHFTFIMDEDEKRNPGARTVQEVIKELIEHIRLLKIKEAKLGQPLVSNPALRTFILESFKRREKIIEEQEPPSGSQPTSMQGG